VPPARSRISSRDRLLCSASTSRYLLWFSALPPKIQTPVAFSLFSKARTLAYPRATHLSWVRLSYTLREPTRTPPIQLLILGSGMFIKGSGCDFPAPLPLRDLISFYMLETCQALNAYQFAPSLLLWRPPGRTLIHTSPFIRP